MGFVSRKVVPRKVRRAAHPVRTAKRKATPKTVKKVRRAAHPVSNAAYRIERDLTSSKKRKKTTSGASRAGATKRTTSRSATQVKAPVRVRSTGMQTNGPGPNWWLWMPLYTLGFFAFVPAIHVAVRTRRKVDLWVAVSLLIGSLGLFAVAHDASSKNQASVGGAILTVVLVVFGLGVTFSRAELIWKGKDENQPPS